MKAVTVLNSLVLSLLFVGLTNSASTAKGNDLKNDELKSPRAPASPAPSVQVEIKTEKEPTPLTVVLSAAGWFYRPQLTRARIGIIKEILGNTKANVLLLLPATIYNNEEFRAQITKSIINNNADIARINYGGAVDHKYAWTRDFVPEIVQEGGRTQIVSFRYPKAEHFQLELLNGFEYHLKKYRNLKDVEIKKVDLVVDGGMYLIDVQNRLFISDAVLDRNAKEQTSLMTNMSNLGAMMKSQPKKTEDDENLPYNLARGPLKVYGKPDIEARLKEALNVNEVIWMPKVSMEYESTQHLDMYAKVISEKDVVVADVPEKMESSDADYKAKYHSVNGVLDDIANKFVSHGYTVTRIPMASLEDTRFYSYANALLVGNVLLLPKFGFKDADAKAEEIYKKLGLKVRRVSGDTLIDGGSVHCLTKTF